MGEFKQSNNCTFATNIVMNPRLLIFISFLLPGTLLAQTAYNFKISTDRMLFHDLVDKQQKAMLNERDSLKLSPDDAINLEVRDVFIRQVDELQEKIESDTALTGQVKVKSLKSLETLLKGYNRYRDKKGLPDIHGTRVVQGLHGSAHTRPKRPEHRTGNCPERLWGG